MSDYEAVPLNSCVRRTADGAMVPADNEDYLKWKEAGNQAVLPAPSRDALDAAIRSGCDSAISAAFSSGGASRRASMNLWVSSVLASSAAQAPLSDDDRNCLAMVPKMNAWEGAMFAERDRLIGASLTLEDAQWPALPDGGQAFVASCDQG